MFFAATRFELHFGTEIMSRSEANQKISKKLEASAKKLFDILTRIFASRF